MGQQSRHATIRARRILAALCTLDDRSAEGNEWQALQCEVCDHQLRPQSDVDLLNIIERSLSALVEHTWGDADDLEELQRLLVVPGVRRAIVAMARVELFAAAQGGATGHRR